MPSSFWVRGLKKEEKLDVELLGAECWVRRKECKYLFGSRRHFSPVMIAQCWKLYCCYELDWTAGLLTPYLGSQWLESKGWGKRKHVSLTTSMQIYVLRGIRGYQKHYWNLSSISAFEITVSNPAAIEQNFWDLVITTLSSSSKRETDRGTLYFHFELPTPAIWLPLEHIS